MAEVNSLEVLIKANADQFRRELNDVNARLGGLGNNAVKGTTKTSAAFSKMGIAAGIAAAAVSAAIGKMVVDSTKFAMSAVESESLVSVVFKGATDDIVAWSNELSSALGLNAYTLRKNAGVFYNIADALGVSNDNALRLSKGLVSLTGDMASFYNISDEEAMVKLRAGITGETEPLKQLGVVVDENTIKQTAYRLGIAQTGNELSNQEKVLARYMTILEQTGTAQGDLARTLDSPTNQLRILKSRIEQIATSLGAIFIPVLNAVLPYIQAFVVLIQRAVTAIGNMLGIVGIKATSKGITETADAIGSVGGNADTASKGVAKLRKELLGLATFDEMNVLKAADSGAGSGGSSGGGGGVGSGMNFEIPEYDMGLDGIQSQVDEIIRKFDFLKTRLGEIMGSLFESDMFQQYIGLWSKMWGDFKVEFDIWSPIIGASVKKLFTSIWKDAITPALDIIKNIWAGLLNEIDIAWENHGIGILNRIGDFVNQVIGLFQSIWDNVLNPIIKPFLEMLGRVWSETFQPMVATVLDFVGKLIKGALDILNKFVLPIVTWLLDKLKPAFAGLGEGISKIMGNILTTIGGVVSGIFKALGGLIDFIVGVFTGDWKKAWNGIKTVFSGILTAIVSIGKGLVNGIIDMINAFIRGLNKSVQIPSWVPAIGGKGFNIPEIRRLATGGIVESPAMAMIGEAGKEAVLPLENNTEWMDDLAEKIGGGQPMNLVINLGGERIYDGFVDFMNDKSMRSNVKLLNI